MTDVITSLIAFAFITIAIAAIGIALAAKRIRQPAKPIRPTNPRGKDGKFLTRKERDVIWRAANGLPKL